jgi:hypothetical protein
MSMQLKIQLVSVAITGGLFLVVFELLRRKRLMERYAILWLISSAVLLALAAWKGLLETVAHAIGIYYAPSALFVLAFGFILVLLLHFSLVISRLADQNKILAQRLGLLQQRLDEHEAALEASADVDVEPRTQRETTVVSPR